MQLLTPKEVATRLSVSTRTVYTWIAEGRLDAVHLSERVTRVPAESVDALVAKALRSSTMQAGDAVAAESPAAYDVTTIADSVDGLHVDARRESERLWEALVSHREQLTDLVERNKGFNARVFGSVIHGDATSQSDIDLLIDALPGMSLFDLAEIEFGAEAILGRKVDVVVGRSLRAEIRERVLSEARPL